MSVSTNLTLIADTIVFIFLLVTLSFFMILLYSGIIDWNLKRNGILELVMKSGRCNSFYLSNFLGVLVPIVIFFLGKNIATQIILQDYFGKLYKINTIPEYQLNMAINFLNYNYEILFVLLIFTFIINISWKKKIVNDIKKLVISTTIDYFLLFIPSVIITYIPLAIINILHNLF